MREGAWGADVDGEALDALADFAGELADAAARVTTASFKDPSFMENIDISVESKTDESPVTFVDREAERQMRALIEARYPEHGIFGEEFGVKPAGNGSRFTWILDPIDGTKSFITGKPLYTTLVCLAIDGSPAVGLIDQPVLRERWIGRKGQRTTMNGVKITTRRRSRLADGYLYATTPHMFSDLDGSADAFERLRCACKVRPPFCSLRAMCSPNMCIRCGETRHRHHCRSCVLMYSVRGNGDGCRLFYWTPNAVWSRV